MSPNRITRLLRILSKEQRQSRRIAARARKRGANKVAARHRARVRFLGKRMRHWRYIRKQKKAAQPTFQTWMLNGRPGNVEPAVKREIAYAVVKHKVVVTSTSTGPHTYTSRHFPRNNPAHNGLGRAFDAGGSYRAMTSYTKHGLRNHKKYAEFFGPPNNRFVKNGVLYNGAIPNHYNHNHVSPYGA